MTKNTKREESVRRHRLHTHAMQAGGIGEAEYLASIADFAEQEHRRYEKRNAPVKFGWDEGP